MVVQLSLEVGSPLQKTALLTVAGNPLIAFAAFAITARQPEKRAWLRTTGGR